MASDVQFGDNTDRHNFHFGSTQVTAIDFGSTNVWQNQLQITNFERTSAASIGNGAGNIGVRVTGNEGAQFSITGGSGASNVGNRTIPAGGVDTFNVPVSAQAVEAAARNPSALLVPNPTAIPPTILSPDFSATNPITVSQAVGRRRGTATQASPVGDTYLTLARQTSTGNVGLSTAAVAAGNDVGEIVINITRNAGIATPIQWRTIGGGNGNVTFANVAAGHTGNVSIPAVNFRGTVFVRTGTVTAALFYDGAEIAGTRATWNVTVG